MKHLIKVFCAIFCIIILVLTISAVENEQYVFIYPELDIKIEFSDDTTLTTDHRKNIADHIVYNTPISQTYSLCWLIGHDITTETVTATYHKRAEYDPRCQLEIYHVEKCSNCDYVYPRLANSLYISCCPPEASAVSIDDSHTH